MFKFIISFLFIIIISFAFIETTFQVLQSQEDTSLYLTPGGKYTEEDIVANGRMTASQKFKGFRANHDFNPQIGDRICPITETKANLDCYWVINGEVYYVCCPPCIDELVGIAKKTPDKLKPSNEYVKK